MCVGQPSHILFESPVASGNRSPDDILSDCHQPFRVALMSHVCLVLVIVRSYARLGFDHQRST
jgi:hypothetical protein